MSAERSEPDPMDVGQPEEAELADEELGQKQPTRSDLPDEEKAEDELEPLEGGAETMADLDEEEERRPPSGPGTERPPL
jgi:hypothetical protein